MFTCICIQIWNVTLWYSAVMSIYSSDQVSTATLPSQELLASTFKLASWQHVRSVGSLISGHNIIVKGSGSKAEVFAVQFVLDTCRQLMDSFHFFCAALKYTSCLCLTSLCWLHSEQTPTLWTGCFMELILSKHIHNILNYGPKRVN